MGDIILDEDLKMELDKSRVKIATEYLKLLQTQVARHRKALGLPREPK
jgi:hypothetical protein